MNEYKNKKDYEQEPMLTEENILNDKCCAAAPIAAIETDTTRALTDSIGVLNNIGKCLIGESWGEIPIVDGPDSSYREHVSKNAEMSCNIYVGLNKLIEIII